MEKNDLLLPISFRSKIRKVCIIRRAYDANRQNSKQNWNSAYYNAINYTALLHFDFLRR